MNPEGFDPVLNLGESAEYLGVSRTTLWRMYAKDGMISPPARFSRGKTGYLQSYLETWKRDRMHEAMRRKG